MQPITPHESEKISVERVISDIHDNNLPLLGEYLDTNSPAEIADLLVSILPTQRTVIWELLSEPKKSEVIPWLRADIRPSLIGEMDDAQLFVAAEAMAVDDLADVLGDFPDQVTQSILEALETDNRKRLETVLSYPEGSAGRLMRTEVLSVRKDVTFSVVLRWLRRHEKLPSLTDALMVTDAEGYYLGKLELANIVTGSPETKVIEAMVGTAEAVRFDAKEHEVATLFEKRELISVAVIDAEGKLCGRITVDDVVDVIRHEADQAFLKSGGVAQEEDLFSPIIPSALRRGVWLGINLITVFMAVWVIGLFEAALNQIVALAVLMPVTASMGGIAGSQTLTLIIRGQAMDQVSHLNALWLVRKELAVGALNGLVWAFLVAIVSLLWFKDTYLSLIIAVALFINLLVASLSGVLIPLTLKRMKIDPALSGAVILTTVTDVVGFLSFLGLASIFLL